MFPVIKVLIVGRDWNLMKYWLDKLGNPQQIFFLCQLIILIKKTHNPTHYTQDKLSSLSLSLWGQGGNIYYVAIILPAVQSYSKYFYRILG